MCYKKIMAESSSGVEGSLVMKRFVVSGRLLRLLGGYGAAALGVALTSFCIGLVKMVAHVENISLAYLLVVLWLAVFFGRGPAILASILAFLSYDFFFIPPTGELITEDPTQWISLLGLLATALVIGHLTATVQAHAAAALASQQPP
jgi:two-component system sensor histidine kinase KdpD